MEGKDNKPNASDPRVDTLLREQVSTRINEAVHNEKSPIPEEHRAAVAYYIETQMDRGKTVTREDIKRLATEAVEILGIKDKLGDKTASRAKPPQGTTRRAATAPDKKQDRDEEEDKEEKVTDPISHLKQGRNQLFRNIRSKS